MSFQNDAIYVQKLDSEDGFSIGSNDLTQLTLGLDRDSGGLVGHVMDTWLNNL